MKLVQWRPMAVQDLRAAAEWYAQQGGLALELRFLGAVEAAIGMLLSHPASGSLRHNGLIPGLPAPLRFHRLPGFGRHLLYYCDSTNHLDVIRLWHASRDLDTLTDTPDAPPSAPDPIE
ncbi:type II toxin-antitoxin system RelE/ParE family toxin [Lysobacter sp. N42]|uniref:type II toxin-antitoxin system RelE/ParE family toxin n=1 Tax=Lysobacter sp. N42 TaxID=2545719 RepID=UPI00104360B8|nr:type II toxin-antitoxin system RelE/ParE family toxin [Lysobacter sp. N42]TCZ87722.1 type II toxin-antitoxin system RelE/ParE family toxin [Lysobacter sp. N42]